MDYKINFKSYDPVLNETKVSITQRYPYRSMEETLVGDRTQDNETKIIDDVLNIIRTEMDPSGAIIKLERALEESTKAVQINHKTVADAQLAMFANAEEIDSIHAVLDQILEHIGLDLSENEDNEHEEQEGEETHDSEENSQEDSGESSGGSDHE